MTVTADDIRGLASWDPKAIPVARDRVPAQPGPAAGLHRRPRRRRPRRDARRHEADGGRPQEDQPAPAGRAGHRPLGPGRRGGHAAAFADERRAGVQPQPASGTRSSAGARTRSRTSASCRPTRIVHQVNLEYLARVVFTSTDIEGGAGGRDAAGLPDTLRRHRLAHDDDQRPGRARLGRRRDRGRGGHARPAGLDARAAGRRVQAHGDAAAKGRRRPTWC